MATTFSHWTDLFAELQGEVVGWLDDSTRACFDRTSRTAWSRRKLTITLSDFARSTMANNHPEHYTWGTTWVGMHHAEFVALARDALLAQCKEVVDRVGERYMRNAIEEVLRYTEDMAVFDWVATLASTDRHHDIIQVRRYCQRNDGPLSEDHTTAHNLYQDAASAYQRLHCAPDIIMRHGSIELINDLVAPELQRGYFSSIGTKALLIDKYIPRGVTPDAIYCLGIHAAYTGSVARLQWAITTLSDIKASLGLVFTSVGGIDSCLLRMLIATLIGHRYDTASWLWTAYVKDTGILDLSRDQSGDLRSAIRNSFSTIETVHPNKWDRHSVIRCDWSKLVAWLCDAAGLTELPFNMQHDILQIETSHWWGEFPVDTPSTPAMYTRAALYRAAWAHVKHTAFLLEESHRHMELYRNSSTPPDVIAALADAYPDLLSADESRYERKQTAQYYEMG